jgi:hypothetical protein
MWKAAVPCGEQSQSNDCAATVFNAACSNASASGFRSNALLWPCPRTRLTPGGSLASENVKEQEMRWAGLGGVEAR